jgi:lipoyl(octanoyl) transferase
VADEVWVVRSGQVPYAYAREAQKALEGARHAGTVPDLLLLLEHPPVYTKGRRSTAAELPMGEDWYRMQGIEVTGTDRGGQVTYHGPGQLVGYPIVDLAPYDGDVHEYVRRMERVMIAALGDHGVDANLIDGLTGVWTAGARPDDPEAFAAGADQARKIGSIGVHVNRGITTHGFAINVSNDLQPFEWIVPCGIEGCRMTSLTRELGAEQDLQEFATTVRDRFGEVYYREPREVAAAHLNELVEGVGALVSESSLQVR